MPGFSDQMKKELQSPSEVPTKPYAIVIPIRKDADWWALDQDTRRTLMQEHTQAALALYERSEAEALSLQRTG